MTLPQGSVHITLKQTGRIVIAGGTGYLGQNLARHFHSVGRDVVVLSRHSPAVKHPWTHDTWDARTLGDWTRHLDGADAVVNLAGRTVDCVKTPDNCDEILRSRVESTEVLGRGLENVSTLPRVWVQMSTAHLYGDPPDVLIDEDAAFGYGFAPFIGGAWEDAFSRAVPPQVRQVILRTSFVLGHTGGALPRLAKLARWGMGGSVGHGRQGISWIHEEDMNRLFAWAIDDDDVTGAYMATAPNPVSNAEFMRELRGALHMPFGLPTMAWMVRLAAPVLRTDPELALYGRFCVSRRLQAEGFKFQFPDLKSALRDLVIPRGSETDSSTAIERTANHRLQRRDAIRKALPMSLEEIQAFLTDLSEVEHSENFGYTFYFVGADHRLPFVTFTSGDNEYDSVSNLDRDGVYRINIGVSRATFEQLFGGLSAEALDYTVLNTFLPHPDYAKQHFICILNPTGEQLQRTKELITEAHSIAEKRWRRKSGESS